MSTALQSLADMLGRNMRKILPDQYSYSLVIWRRIDETTVELSSSSHGEPFEVASVLTDLAQEVVNRELSPESLAS